MTYKQDVYQDIWIAVDAYIVDRLIPADAALSAALAASTAANLPSINVAPNQGRLLNLLARMIGARRILEIGTLGGYSTIWLARALPADGKLITLELEPKHADVAEANFRNAGVADRIELRRGVAMQSLVDLAKAKVSDFDFVFIDADKQSCAEYFAWALDHTRVGGVIVVDNVVRGGAVIDSGSVDESVVGVRRFLQMLSSEKRVDATALQTVGAKGYDGLSFALVVSR